MKKLGLIITILFTLVMSGCKRQNPVVEVSRSSLELTLPESAKGFIEAKAVANPIKDIWVIQLKGTEVIASEYLVNDTFNPINRSLFMDITFEVGVDMLYVVTNTAKPDLYTGVTTKAEMLAKQIPFKRTSSVTSELELPMAGWGSVSATATLNRVKLTYLVAKMNVSVKTDNLPAGASYKGRSIKVYRIPQVLSLDTTAMPSPAVGAANFGEDLEFMGSESILSSGDFYIASNRRGVGSATSPINKTKTTAPTGQGDWCTYVDVIGEYKESSSAPVQTVVYKLWLGDNVTNNYTVRGGSFYNVSISILNSNVIDARITVYSNSFDLGMLPPDGINDGETGFVNLLPPANSYVSYPVDGTYKILAFNALKKPIAKYTDGSSTILNTTGSNPSTVSADATLSNDIVYQYGDRLEVVWQTAVNHQSSGAMVIKSVYLAQNGVGTVEVNGPGNALVAYKRGSTILWNFHIWATDSDPFVNHYATGSPNVNGTVDGGTATGFMDRNLGALSATTATPTTANAYKYFGVLYQYGRPTPFTGQGPETSLNTYPVLFDMSGSIYSSINNNKNTGGFPFVNDAVSSVTTAIQFPMRWYYLSVGNNTWYNFGDVALWSSYGTNKSIYDPCPYGYRVPKAGAWNGFPTATWTNAINGGIIVSGTWWPATGFRWGDSDIVLVNTGAQGRYWSSSLAPSNFSYMSIFSSGGTNYPSNAYQRSSGNAVRCVQEGY